MHTSCMCVYHCSHYRLLSTTILYFLAPQNVLRMFDIKGTFLRVFPLGVGAITGYSGQKKDSDVRTFFTSSG